MLSTGNSKMEGIRIVGEEFGFSMDQVMAFGDSDNDLEMLSGVGLSIAMGNGTTSVKAIAKHTTTSNGKDGIQKALQHFGILSEKELFLSKDDHFNKVKTFQWRDGWRNSRKTCCLAASRCPLSDHVQARGVSRICPSS